MTATATATVQQQQQEHESIISLPPEEQRAFLRRIFDEYDTDQNHFLSVAETSAALQKAQLPSDRESVRRMRCAIRGEEYVEGGVKGATGRDISFEEFAAFYSARVERLSADFDRFVAATRDARRDHGDRTSPRKEAKKRHILFSALREIVEADTNIKVHDSTIKRLAEMLGLDSDEGEVTLDAWLRGLLLVPEMQGKSFIDQIFYHRFGSAVYKRAPEVKANKSQDEMYILLKKSVCGGVAGVVSRTATAPIDRVRVVMQVGTPTVPRPTIKQAITIILADGKSSMWSKTTAFFASNGINVIKIAPEMAVKLQAFDAISAYFTGNDPKNASAWSRICAGGAAGFVAESVSHPLDVVRTRLAAAPRGTYGGIWHCCTVVWRSGGIPAFYAGMAPALVGVVPFAAVDLSCNSFFRDRARIYMKKNNITQSYPLFFACGCASSAIAMTSTFPLYTLKTRIAVSNEGIRKTIVGLAAQGNLLRGLYRGYVPAICKVMPASGIAYGTYSWLDEKL